MSVEPSTLSGFTSPKDVTSAGGIAPGNVPPMFSQYLGVPPEAYLPMFGGPGFPGNPFFPVPQRQALPTMGDCTSNGGQVGLCGASKMKTEPLAGMLPAGFASYPPAAAAMAMMLNPNLKLAMLNADLNMRAATQRSQQSKVGTNSLSREETNNNAAPGTGKSGQSAAGTRGERETSGGELDLSIKSYTSPVSGTVIGGGCLKGVGADVDAKWPGAISGSNQHHGQLAIISHCT